MSADRPFDVCVVGHVTRDLIRDASGALRSQTGGAAYYGAAALARLGLRTRLVTRLAAADDGLLAELRALGIAVERKPSAATTVFEAAETAEPGHRNYRAVSVADPFEAEDFASVQARAILMDPLTRHDNFVQVMGAAARAAPIVALDAQGFVRKFLIPGVADSVLRAALEGFAALSIVKADAAEARAITGEAEPEAAARALAGLGPREVIVTSGGAGSLVFADGMTERIPAYPVPRIADPTGAGDSYLAGYLAARLEGKSPRDAALFGAAAASLKLAHVGAFAGTRPDVERLLAAQSA